MAIVRDHSQQELRVALTPATKNSLRDDRCDQSPHLTPGQPRLPGLALFIPGPSTAQVEPDAIVVNLAGIDPPMYRPIALHQPGGIHAGPEVELVSGFVAVAQNPALLPQAADELSARRASFPI
jgi:hypothetical protein